MSNVFEVDIIKIDENTSSKTISQWDSFNHLNLVVKIEEEFVLREITEVFVPIYEARLIGPKKKVGIIRIDAVRNKIL